MVKGLLKRIIYGIYVRNRDFGFDVSEDFYLTMVYDRSDVESDMDTFYYYVNGGLLRIYDL